MDYMPLTYPCPKCGGSNVAQDPVCALIGKPIMLHFCCLDCHHQWDRQYEPPTILKLTKKEAAAMQVSYNGFTGKLVKLEYKNRTYNSRTGEDFASYDLSIYDSEKQVTHSFTSVKLEDVKFLGGAVAFGG